MSSKCQNQIRKFIDKYREIAFRLVKTSDYPGERLIACRNAALATERRRKREALLVATETELARIRDATRRKRAPLHGEATIGLAVGAVINQRKMAKHFDLTITASRCSATIWVRRSDNQHEKS